MNATQSARSPGRVGESPSGSRQPVAPPAETWTSYASLRWLGSTVYNRYVL